MAQYRPRAPRNFAHPLLAVEDAVEIVVSLGSPMPIRALAPVLYVGEIPLTESERVDREGTQIRFWAFDRAKLRRPGAPIMLGWSGEPPPKGQKRPKLRRTRDREEVVRPSRKATEAPRPADRKRRMPVLGQRSRRAPAQNMRTENFGFSLDSCAAPMATIPLSLRFGGLI